ncbi:MAG: hypothetical protein OHK0012_02620 [Synechococcales cyanobacterium]
MQATSRKEKATRKGISFQPIFWTAGLLLTAWYLTPPHLYAQPTHVQLNATYQPAGRL